MRLSGHREATAEDAVANPHGDLRESEPNQTAGGGTPTPLRLKPWPSGAPFALFLSHDVDQIHDRELFRILADLNHIRRRLTQGEPGNARLSLQRVLRSFCRPKRTLLDFETILEIERRHEFRSTFFLLHDKYFARQGARYSFAEKELGEIGRRVLGAGCELGVHGGYYRFNNADLYRESKEALAEVFGIQPAGIRNHLLRFSYPETWRAQAQAGFQYDATYGLPDTLGPRDGLAFPFFPSDRDRRQTLDLLELPLTIMDTTLFRYLKLQGDQALESAWEAVKRVADAGGLVTLLWHNNFFNEPEYWDWQMVYERLLERLAGLKPWCATGAEINRWWRARAAIRVETTNPGVRRATLFAPLGLADLVVSLPPDSANAQPRVSGAQARCARAGEETHVYLPPLRSGERVVLEW
jgi:peptidoglycan/xylan/chitin deacetylase (PgdA/CDA1 family)